MTERRPKYGNKRVNRDELVSMSGRRVPLGQITSIEEVNANGD